MSSLAPGAYADDAQRYLLESRIATGGMGEVWRARDTVLNRAVAVKLLKPEFADDALSRTRFETEARHAASLHHGSIAGVFDFGEAAGVDGSSTPRPYIVMELVEGQPLSDLLRPSAPLDPYVARDLMAQAADALGAAHARGIVHRDVKPANLIVTPDRRVKVTDFGIARAAEGVALTQTGQVMGTPAYISPEQAEGGPATAASDVYSLAAVAFECLVGRKPYLAESPVASALAHVRDPVPELPDTVPADLAAVVRRALSKSPDDRFADGTAFAQALRDPASAIGGHAPTVIAPVAAATRVMPAAAASGAPATIATPQNVAQPPLHRDTPGNTRRNTPGRTPRRALPWPLILGIGAVLLALLVAWWLGSRSDETAAEDSSGTPSRTASPSKSPPPSPSQTPTKTPSQSPTETPVEPEPTTVEVDPATYIGLRAKDTDKQLRELGLETELVELANTGEAEKDVVADVSPSGTLEEGDLVTISFYGKPEASPGGGDVG